MARDVRISAEAAAAIGPARASALAAGPDPGRYTCGSCRQPGDADFEPTSILVYRHPGGILSVVCAHAACCPSTVEDRDDFDASVMDQVRVVPVILSGAVRDRWAALVIQPRVPVELAVPTGPDRTSAQVSGWLRDGLSLMGTVPSLPPPAADGWRVVLLAADGTEYLVRVTVLCRSGVPGGPAVVAEDMPIVPVPGWLDIARSRGAVPVYAGLTGLDRTQGQAPYKVARALAAAGGKGLLAGGLAEAAVISLQCEER